MTIAPLTPSANALMKLTVGCAKTFFSYTRRKLNSLHLETKMKFSRWMHTLTLGVKQLCGEGGVVQRSLQRERELGEKRWVSGSSAYDKYPCLVPVSGVERTHKGTGKRRSKERETDCWLVTVELVLLWRAQVYIAYAPVLYWALVTWLFVFRKEAK